MYQPQAICGGLAGGAASPIGNGGRTIQES
jgi:hypothetical protein